AKGQGRASAAALLAAKSPAPANTALKQADAEVKRSDVFPISGRFTLSTEGISQALQIETIIKNKRADWRFNPQSRTRGVAQHRRVKFAAVCPKVARVHVERRLHRTSQGDAYFSSGVDEDVSSSQDHLSNGKIIILIEYLLCQVLRHERK